MKVQIEDMNGEVVFLSAFDDDAVMDAEQVAQDFFGSEVELLEVSFAHESLGCYDYRVIFFDDTPFSVVSSGAFYIKEYA